MIRFLGRLRRAWPGTSLRTARRAAGLASLVATFAPLASTALAAPTSSTALAAPHSTTALPAPGAAPRLEEVVVTVADLRPLEAAFTQVLKWQVVFRGNLRPAEVAGWGLAPGTRGRQLLLGSPSAAHGRIRFVALDAGLGGRAEPMRPAPRWWDTGGAFAVNLFVDDAEAAMRGLRARGWSTALPMQAYEERAGERVTARGRFARMVGPDDFVLSFQQREVPALEKWPRFVGASHVENVMEPVTDLGAWTTVAAALLGVEAPPRTRRDIVARPEAAASYGLPASLAAAAGAEQSILRIGPAREQMLTGWRFDSLRGVDHAARIDARHLGVLALRVRVADAAAAAARLAQAGIAVAAAVEPRPLRPYGAVRSVVVRAGGGSNLLLEAFDADATQGRRR